MEQFNFKWSLAHCNLGTAELLIQMTTTGPARGTEKSKEVFHLNLDIKAIIEFHDSYFF